MSQDELVEAMDKSIRELMKSLEVDLYGPRNPKEKSKVALQDLTLRLLGWTKDPGWGNHWHKTDHNGVMVPLSYVPANHPGGITVESLEAIMKDITFS